MQPRRSFAHSRASITRRSADRALPGGCADSANGARQRRVPAAQCYGNNREWSGRKNKARQARGASQAVAAKAATCCVPSGAIPARSGRAKRGGSCAAIPRAIASQRKRAWRPGARQPRLVRNSVFSNLRLVRARRASGAGIVKMEQPRICAGDNAARGAARGGAGGAGARRTPIPDS